VSRCGVEVTRLDRNSGAWSVATSDGAVEAERVVLATGHSNEPYVPRWPGAFEGDIAHAANYRNPVPYAGRRVLVVGAGNSGAEIAVDVAEGGAAATFLEDLGKPLVHGAQEHSLAPGIHFVGYEVTLGGTFRSVGIQAQQLAGAVAAS
jgi:pyruvate/2-oxoglutarate dehydrogenase complex dihydrolipoamide dehydrogenase (E3) component